MSSLQQVLEIVKRLESAGVNPNTVIGYEAVMGEVCDGLSRLCTAIEQKQTQAPTVNVSPQIDMGGIAQALASALASIQINAPPVNVQVAAPDINLPQASSPVPRGWTVEVTKRDELGRMRQMKLTPEN
jgi:hypothetical protein